MPTVSTTVICMVNLSALVLTDLGQQTTVQNTATYVQTLLQPLLPPPKALHARISSTTVRHMVNLAVPDSLNPGRVTTAVSTVDSVVPPDQSLTFKFGLLQGTQL